MAENKTSIEESLGLDKFDDEKTYDYPTIDPAYYTAAIGRSYLTENKQGWKSKTVDLILLQKSKDGNPPLPMLDQKTEGSEIVVSMRKNKAGEPLLDFIFKAEFPNLTDAMTSKAKAFFTFARREFAKQLGALNEDTGEIKWSAIQNSVGKVITFDLVENYKNKAYPPRIDFGTVAIMPTAKVSVKSIADIYTKLAEINSAKTAKKSDLPEEPPF